MSIASQIGELPARAWRGLRWRNYRSTSSGWYLRAVRGAGDDSEFPASGPVSFAVLRGDERARLHAWLARHRTIYPWVFFPAEIAAAERYDHCYPALRHEERIVGYVKLARERVYVHDFECEIDLPPKVAFVYDTFIEASRRGQGLGAKMLRETGRFLAREGFRGVACHIEDGNEASIGAFRQAGYERVGTISYRRLGRARKWIIDGDRASAAAIPGWLERRLDEHTPRD